MGVVGSPSSPWGRLNTLKINCCRAVQELAMSAFYRSDPTLTLDAHICFTPGLSTNTHAPTMSTMESAPTSKMYLVR